MSLNVMPELYIGLQETFTKVITEGEAALYAGLVGDNRMQTQSSSQGGEDFSDRKSVV